METSLSPIALVAIFAGILALGAVVVAFRMRPAKPSRVALAVTALPALMMLGLFYSLAVHMHQSLGAWPSSIGERGFRAPLVTHAHIAAVYFSIVLLLSIFAWPAIFLLCLVVRRWRGCVYYVGVYAFSCLVSFGAMLLAPSQFLNW